MTAEDLRGTKIARKREARARCACPAILLPGHFIAYFPSPTISLAPGPSQHLTPSLCQPHSAQTPHLPHSAADGVTYSHEGPAQVDSRAAPVHGIVQDAEGEAGDFCLHQDAEVITCRASRGFLVRIH